MCKIKHAQLAYWWLRWSEGVIGSDRGLDEEDLGMQWSKGGSTKAATKGGIVREGGSWRCEEVLEEGIKASLSAPPPVVFQVSGYKCHY